MQRKLAFFHRAARDHAARAGRSPPRRCGARARAPTRPSRPSCSCSIRARPSTPTRCAASCPSRWARRSRPRPRAASAEGTPADTTHVFVGCVPGSPQLVRLEVRDPESGRRVDRVITLVGDSKTDQARLVAIVAVELVATSRSELREAAPAPVATPAPDAHAARRHGDAPRRRPRSRRRGGARSRSARSATSRACRRLLPGGGLVRRARRRRAASCSRPTRSPRARRVRRPSATSTPSSLARRARRRGGSSAAASPGEAGAGRARRRRAARGRDARGAATPVLVAPSVLSGPWAGRSSRRARRRPSASGSGVVLSLGGEVGYVTSAVAGHVEGHPDVAVSGAWWNVVLGVGYAL